MKTKALLVSLVFIFLTFSMASAQTKKKVAKKKPVKREWDRQLVDKSGNDARFSKHKKRKFYKPGEALREDK
jgi:hypothetical protein